MQVNYTKSMRRAFILSLVLTASLQASPTKAAAGQVTSIGGADSYETAAKVATTNWSNPKDVVLVCGEGYADAVSATVLAKQLNAPILLTTANSLNESTQTALDTLKPQNIYVIGGTASISQTVRTSLKNDNYNLIELGGKNRYETNIAVANELIKLGVSADSVMLVSGQGFADVLSATPVAAAKGQILLLGNNDASSMKPVLDFVKTNNSSVTVVGTSNAIKDDIYESLGAVKRINGGANRFETNINVLNEFKDDLKTDKLFVANASGERYTDALIASSLAGKWNAPLVLVDDETSDSTSNAINYIKGKIKSSTDLSAIGETGIISDTIVSRINSAVSSAVTASYSPTVQSVTTNGLNQIKVVFNTPVDETSAEQIQNYSIEGSVLGSTSDTVSSATLQEDGKTVLITFTNPFQQYKKVNFMVKNAILDLSLKNTIAKFEQQITFSDTTTPTLQSLTPVGGNKLVLKFSEPIRMTSSDLSTMKINRQSVSNYGLNTTQTVFKNSSGSWSDTVELYFDSPLPTGTNKFTMPNGEVSKRFDNGGGFPITGSSVDFNISSMSGTPTVKSVTSDNSKTIYITYDRTMDRQTALEDSNYKINGSIVSVSSSNIGFVDGTNDTVVKIKNLSYSLKTGSNHIEISNDVKDSYGNSLKTTTTDFTYGDDTTKPKLTNATVRDGKTLRIKFDKDVQSYYATNKSNYKILDSDGIDISYKINEIDNVYSSNTSNTDIYDIIFKDSDTLKGYKYTLTVSNIPDTGTTPNVMDTYTTTVAGLDKDSPDVTTIVKSATTDQELVVFFNRAMDESTITNLSNYYYMDGDGNTQKLPRTATILPGIDDKCVIIDFPSSYKLGITGSGDRYVTKFAVTNLKDKDGNALINMTYDGNISTDYTDGPKLVDNTARLYYSGNDIKVRFSLTAPLDLVNLSDFKVAGQKPDSAMIEGNDVILTYKSGINDNTKIDQIQSAGTTATLSISSTSSVDAAGRKLRASSDVIVIPPRTRSDSWTAHSSGGYNTVTLVFDQYIDDDIKSSYSDDFIFTNERTGEKLEVAYVTVDGKNVIYNFNNGSMKVGDKIDICANSDSSVINIRDNENSNGNYEVYTPTLDDLNGRTIVVH